MAGMRACGRRSAWRSIVPPLVNVVFNDMNVPTIQAVPADSPFYDADLKVPARDVAKAKALLAEAGVKTPVPVELMVANNPDTEQAGEVIQSMAAEAGFDVHIRATEFATTLTLSEQGDYQALLIGWSGRVDIDGNVYAFLHSQPGAECHRLRQPHGGRLAGPGARPDRRDAAQGVVRADDDAGRAGSADHLFVDAEQHRGDVGEAARVPRRCRTA